MPNMDDELTLEQRVTLIEWALARIQDTNRIPYLGLCVNASLDYKNHPHWDDDQIAMVVKVVK
jgi:hypothetical protein